jgi:uncharacterized membrane protein YqjE
MDRVGNTDARHNGANGTKTGLAEPESIGQLFRRATADSSHLVQQEIRLAKTELRETGAQLGSSAGKLGVALAFALPGMLALTAFLVIGVGDLIDNYWASALIVGVGLLAAGAVLAKRALATLKEGVGLPETAETLREDAAWAKEEAQNFKRELTA